MLERTRRRAGSLLKFVAEERNTRSGRPDLGMLARGFVSAHRSFYPFATYPPALFLTDYASATRLARVGDQAARSVTHNKYYFHLAMVAAGFGSSRPEVPGLVVDGRYHRAGGSEPTLAAALDRHRRLVAKPVEGRGGAGVTVLTTPADIDEVASGPAGTYLLESCVEQHPALAEIFPDAVNTIRVLTMIHPATQRPFIPAAALRVGTSASAPTDNVSRQALAAGVDVTSGTVSAAIRHPMFGPVRPHAHHPETGAQIEGRVIPLWDAVRDLVLAVASAFSYLPYVGWDVAVGPGRPVIVEGNSGFANPRLVQAYRPLLASAEARDFLVHHGVITRRRARRAGRAAKRLPGHVWGSAS